MIKLFKASHMQQLGCIAVEVFEEFNRRDTVRSIHLHTAGVRALELKKGPHHTS